MKKFAVKFAVLVVMLLGLPLGGVFFAGRPIPRYFEFPPVTEYVNHAPFSWFAFAAYSAFLLAVVAPLAIRAVRMGRLGEGAGPERAFPWWGWLGLASGGVFWLFAWTSFPWFSKFQPHTFAPLWLSFIVVINALRFRRDGRCMMLDRPYYFLLLFPASALFWWFFEYLNRFVQNWRYQGVYFSPAAYVVAASVSFSTVLPGVLGTRDWILGASWLERAFSRFWRIKVPRPTLLAWAVLVASGAGLGGIGVWPNDLFPLLWVSPLLILASLQRLLGEDTIFAGLGEGDWTFVVSSALAALFCGFFWEMWNYYSLARWEYAIPFVDRYRVFEMPILGYGGYLPFGMECAAVGEILSRFPALRRSAIRRPSR